MSHTLGDTLVAELNKRHAVVRETGKTVVLNEEWDHVLGRRILTRSSFASFKNFWLTSTPKEPPTRSWFWPGVVGALGGHAAEAAKVHRRGILRIARAGYREDRRAALGHRHVVDREARRAIIIANGAAADGVADGGVGRRVVDRPLCFIHNRAKHAASSEKDWWARYKIEPEAVLKQLWAESR